MTARAILHAVYGAKDRRNTKRAKAAVYIPRPPVAAEMSYVSKLRRAWDETSREIAGIVEDEMRPLTDGPERTDADPVRAVIERIREALLAKFSAETFMAVAAAIHAQINAFNLREVAASLVVSPQMLPGMREMSAMWSEQNARLIVGMTDEIVADLAANLRDEWAAGARWESIAETVQARLGVGRSRAELIARDQVLKLNSDLTQERQRAVGVTRYRWSSSRDERVRQSHRALEGTIHRWTEPPIVDPRTGARAHPGVHFQCLPGEQRIQIAHGVTRAIRRSCAGQKLVSVVTREGHNLEMTPNHPALTRAGWKPAHALNVGDELVHVGDERGLRSYAHEQHGPPTIEEVFDALRVVGFAERVAGCASQFHGDGSDGDVDVVTIDWPLRIEIDSALAEDVAKRLLAHADPAFTRSRASDAMSVALGLAPNRLVGRPGQALSVLGACARHADSHRFGSAPNGYAAIAKEIAQRISLDAVLRGERLDTLSAEVSALRIMARIVVGVVRDSFEAPREADAAEFLSERLLVNPDGVGDLRIGKPLVTKFDRVIDVSLREHSGHVYNLETSCGWYAASHVVHNCRCVAIPVFDD